MTRYVILTTLALVAATCTIPAAAGELASDLTIRPGDLTIVVSTESRVCQRAGTVFARVVRERTGIEVPNGEAKAPRRLEITIEAGPGTAAHADGFRIVTDPSGRRLRVVGDSPAGVAAGVGCLLRRCTFGAGALRVPALDLRDAPALPVRGMYFATHFGNFYDAAPLEEIDRVIEDLALWGVNQLVVWFDMHHFQSFDAPEARRHLQRLRHMADTARSLGMKAGLCMLGNEGYASTPEHLRAKWKKWWPHYHVEVCPSTPEGLALIGREQERVLRAFGPIDVAWSWPYDQGGCACEQCMPWGGNGFLKVSRQLSEIYHRLNPQGHFWVSTWLFDAWDERGTMGTERVAGRGDYEGLFREMQRAETPWFHGLIAGTHGTWLPEPLLERPHAQRYPLASFPEISMYHMSPWGGFGANPLPSWCTKLAAALRGHVVGGWPYSEGIYEDLNKFFWTRFYWNPDADTPGVLRVYAKYYLGEPVADDAVRLFGLLERTHARNNWQVSNLKEAPEAYAQAQSIEARLPEWAAKHWRWRILMLRARIDATLAARGLNSPEGRATLEACRAELVRLYHAEKAQDWLMPPQVPASAPE